MGRPGVSGGGRSGGGGHHMGGISHSSRPGSGSSHRSGSSSGSSHSSYHSGPAGKVPRGPIVHHHHYYGRRHYGGGGVYGGNSGCGGGCLTSVILVILILVLFGIVGAVLNSDNSSVAENGVESTIVREKLDTKDGFTNDCIKDELGWFDNETKTETGLKRFWNETGVQPYILLRKYDSSLTTNEEKIAWAENYYEEHFDTENIFLFVYFEEKDEDEIGYMSYVNGHDTSRIMDSEAMEIFWNYLDSNWVKDISTDEMFLDTFDDTAKTIMHTAKTKEEAQKEKASAWKWSAVAVTVIGAGIVAVVLVNKRNKRKKEEAEERERILKTSVSDLVDEKSE